MKKQELLNAVREHRFAGVEDLLKMGADPLGSPEEKRLHEHILEEMFGAIAEDRRLGRRMPGLLELFFRYGMDISRCNAAENGRNDVHPLWPLAFCQSRRGWKVLKKLLDHGLDAQSAEKMVGHILLDMEICDGAETEDAFFGKSTVCALKMVMLTAAYPHVLNEVNISGSVSNWNITGQRNCRGLRSGNGMNTISTNQREPVCRADCMMRC